MGSLLLSVALGLGVGMGCTQPQTMEPFTWTAADCFNTGTSVEQSFDEGCNADGADVVTIAHDNWHCWCNEAYARVCPADCMGCGISVPREP